MPRHVVILAAAAALAACATGQTASMTPGEGRDCFRTESVSGYQVVDDHNIRARISGTRSYTLGTNWNVNDLDWSHVIALRSDTGWICTGNVFGSVEVSGGSDPINRRYPINTVTRDPEPPADQLGS